MKNKVAVINAYITTDKIIQNNHFPDQGRYHNVYGIDLYSSCDKVQYSVAVMDARTVNRYGAYDARRPRRKWICLCLNTRWRCPNILRFLLLNLSLMKLLERVLKICITMSQY